MKALVTLLVVFISIASKAQEMIVLDSKYLKTADSCWIFKPKNYVQNASYPAVFLLHGHSANYKSWSNLADLQKLATDYNFIIVCPDGLSKSWYINSPKQSGWQYESFFIKELLPYLSEKLNIDRQKLFITGASMGGHGAMWLFLKHPDVFLSAGSISGVLNLRHSGFKKTTLADLLGEYSEENKSFDDYSVVNHLESIKGSNKEIIFDCGTEDYLYIANKKFREKCDELKIKATYTARPGAHTGGYWAESILEHFKFFNALLNKTQ